jgi:mutator protein MutT
MPTSDAIIPVVAAVIRRDGKVLIARRAPGDALAGMWEFPGGKVEPGETPEHALARELGEEFAVEAKIGDFVASRVHDYGTRRIDLMAYHASVDCADLQPLEHDAVAWVAPADLFGYPLAPADIFLVSLLTAGRQA